jgi:hypothetical protein
MNIGIYEGYKQVIIGRKKIYNLCLEQMRMIIC